MDVKNNTNCNNDILAALITASSTVEAVSPEITGRVRSGAGEVIPFITNSLPISSDIL